MQTNQHAELLDLDFGCPLSAVARAYGGLSSSFHFRSQSSTVVIRIAFTTAQRWLFLCFYFHRQYKMCVDSLLVVDIANVQTPPRGHVGKTLHAIHAPRVTQ